MKIAIIGVRGIPVVYGGFETLAQKLSTEFVKRGNQVSVYCRRHYVHEVKKSYRGVELIILPTLQNKYLETFIHSLLSTVHAIWFRQYDCIYYLGVGSAPFVLLPKFFGIKTIINVDGLDWQREKWNFLARLYLKTAEYLATAFCDKVVTDSLYIKGYYQRKYHRESEYLPYGFFEEKIASSSIVKRHQLKKANYLVWAGRLVPENHVDELIRAFNQTKTKLTCVIIGDDFYEKKYKNEIVKLAKTNKNIIFTGFVRHDSYAVLVKNALAYVETKRSGGTHPSLIEAMGLGVLIISNDSQANKEILGQAAIYYHRASPITDLSSAIGLITMPRYSQKIASLRKLVYARAIKHYRWRSIIDRYERLFQGLFNRSHGKSIKDKIISRDA